MNEFGYRYDFDPCPERDAASVMAYETVELQNTDILETLLHGVLEHDTFANRLQEALEAAGSDDWLTEYTDAIPFFKEALERIEAITGHRIKYALWLAKPEAVLYCYDLDHSLTEDDLDCYRKGPVLLSHVDYDGDLYGYEELPEPEGKGRHD